MEKISTVFMDGIVLLEEVMYGAEHFNIYDAKADRVRKWFMIGDYSATKQLDK